MRSLVRSLGCALLWTATAFGVLQQPEAEPAYQLEHDVAIAMRDGVVLRADVLRPKTGGPFAVLVYRTPYGKDHAQGDYTTFRRAVERGYAVVIEDVRGRYASEGEFVAYQHEGPDSYDTIEWAARQPWSNGKVGTFGLSYPGAVQWLAAVEAPPHLVAMVPAMTFSTPRNFFYSGGCFDLSWPQWLLVDIAGDARARKHLPGARTYAETEAWWAKEHARVEGFLPLAELPDLHEIAPFYYEWLRHPAYDPWWDWAELRGKYARVKAAVLNLSGWYDEAYGPEGATTNLNGLLESRRDWQDAATKTIIGPWVHGVAATGRGKAGDRTFPADAAIDYDQTVLDWMDHYLRGVNNGVERGGRLRLFVMGENAWHEEAQWPLRAARPQAFYLRGRGQEAVGALTSEGPAEAASFSEYVSDPQHPLSDPYESYGAHDYRVLAGRPDVLLFDTPPLERDTEVTGPIRAEIYVSVDVPDADLWVRLLDVAPDGTALNLMSPGLDVQRLSYRNRTANQELLYPGQIYKIVIDTLRTGNVFQKGHRIRVQVSSAFFPHFSRNLQTGKLEMTTSESRIAHVRVYHDRAHPSQVVLPVVTR